MRIAVNPGMLGVFCFVVNLVSCMVRMSMFSLLVRIFNSSVLFLIPFMFIWIILRLAEGPVGVCVSEVFVGVGGICVCVVLLCWCVGVLCSVGGSGGVCCCCGVFECCGVCECGGV